MRKGVSWPIKSIALAADLIIDQDLGIERIRISSASMIAMIVFIRLRMSLEIGISHHAGQSGKTI